MPAFATHLLTTLLAGCSVWVPPYAPCDPESDASRYHLDQDGDGYGDDDRVLNCSDIDPAKVYARRGGDCDDLDAQVHPEQSEACNGLDDDCNGDIDDAPDDPGTMGQSGATLWYRDADEDGYGVAEDSIVACAASGEYRSFEDRYFDCDDTDPQWSIRCPWVAIDTEYTRTCARDTVGRITCWGDSRFGELNLPEGPTQVFDATSVGFKTTCALTAADRSIVCWGAPGDDDDDDDHGSLLVAPTGEDHTAVSVGSNHACAIRASGEIECWGDAQYLLPADFSNQRFAQVEANQYVSIARSPSGEVYWWGAYPFDAPPFAYTRARAGASKVAAGALSIAWLSSSGRLTVVPYAHTAGYESDLGLSGSYTDLCAGGSHVCVRRGSTWECRTVDGAGWVSPPEGIDSLTCGYDHDCRILAEDGSLTCWGYAGIPEAVNFPQSYERLALGDSFTAAVRDDPRVVTWGESPGPWTWEFTDADALGSAYLCGLDPTGGVVCWDGSSGLREEGPFLQIAVGGAGACAIKADDRSIACFGHTYLDGRWEAPSGEFTSLEAGASWQCGVTIDSRVRCWGWWGPEATIPLDLSWGEAGVEYTSVTVGWSQACAIRRDGGVDCWSSDGTAVVHPEYFPDDGVRALAIAEGRWHRCAILSESGALTESAGPIECWVEPDTSDTIPPSTDDAPADDERFTQVSAGMTYTCALRTDGTPYCWGDDLVSPATPQDERFEGLLTAGSFACGLRRGQGPTCWGAPPDLSVTAPVELSARGGHGCATGTQGTACFGDDSDGQSSPPDGGPYTSLAAGRSHTCGLRADHSIACWGDDSWGQRSDIPSGSYAALAAGDRHTCAIDDDGAATCWGDNSDEQVDAPPTVTFEAITAGAEHSCGLAPDGSAFCWGNNDWQQATPPGGVGFASLSAGGFHTCGLDEAGAAYCWGLDSFGQVSDVPPWTFVSISAGEEHTCGLKADGLAECWGRDIEGQTDAPFPWDQ